jgi:hypothetical protein
MWQAGANHCPAVPSLRSRIPTRQARESSRYSARGGFRLRGFSRTRIRTQTKPPTQGLVVVCRLGRPCRNDLGDRIRCSAIDSTSEPLTKLLPQGTHALKASQHCSAALLNCCARRRISSKSIEIAGHSSQKNYGIALHPLTGPSR